MPTAQPINTLHPVNMSSNQTPAWGGAAPCWGSQAEKPTWSLNDVMSEQLANQLLEAEQDPQTEPMSTSEPIDLEALAMAAPGTDSTTDDYILAQMLQHEFDKEHDAFLDKEENHWNGTSKVKISLKNYRSVHPHVQADEEAEDEEEAWEDEDKDDPLPHFNKGGIAGKGKNIISKHDAGISGRRNAYKMDQFPPEFVTGDSRGMKIRLPNNVYNKLKRHSVEESKRGHKIHEKKEFSTAEMAVDAKTRLILYKLVNSAVLDSVEGVVSTGKESVVFHGTGGSMPDSLVPKECAIKVFKTTLASFKNRYEYVQGDMRFAKNENKKQSSRKIINIWADKELANLRRMESCGIPCPKPVVLKKHVLLMEFLGSDQVPAPKLRHAKLSAEDMEDAYAQCVQNMCRMFQECRLVHADLSPYNMLWYKDMVHFIDVAQAVDILTPHAMEFLLRDCQNVVRFFKQAGVYGVMNEYELFNKVTGLNLTGIGKDFLLQVEKYEKNPDKLQPDQGKEYPFDYFFEKAQKEREENRNRLEELFDASDSADESDGDDVMGKEVLDPEIEGKLRLSLKLSAHDNESDEGDEDCDLNKSSREELAPSHDSLGSAGGESDQRGRDSAQQGSMPDTSSCGIGQSDVVLI